MRVGLLGLAGLLALTGLGAGCGGSAHADLQRSLAAWEEGKARLAEHDPAGARAAFRRAQAIDPSSPALVAWEVEAVMAAGEPGEALGLLDAGLDRFPADRTLRYNRAALRARGADLEGAATDLRLLYDAHQIDPSDVAEDPDFALLASDPTLSALVPQPRLSAVLVGEGGSVLLGEDVVVRIVLDAPLGEGREIAPLRGRIDRAADTFRLSRLVLDLGAPVGRRVPASLELTYVALRAGDRPIGPWTFDAGRATAAAGPTPAVVVALPGRPEAPLVVQPDELPLPILDPAVAGQPWSGALGGWPALVAPAEARIELEGEVPGLVRVELRRQGQAVVSGVAAPPGAALHGRVTRGGETLLRR